MTTAYWCVLAAGLMPIVWAAIAKTTTPGFNNKRPREFLANLTGLSQRANWAQQNSFEALPLFAAAVIISHIVGTAEQSMIDVLALSFIGFRIIFGICYLGNWHMLRTLSWLAAIICVISLFAISA